VPGVHHTPCIVLTSKTAHPSPFDHLFINICTRHIRKYERSLCTKSRGRLGPSYLLSTRWVISACGKASMPFRKRTTHGMRGHNEKQPPPACLSSCRPCQAVAYRETWCPKMGTVAAPAAATSSPRRPFLAASNMPRRATRFPGRSRPYPHRRCPACRQAGVGWLSPGTNAGPTELAGPRTSRCSQCGSGRGLRRSGRAEGRVPHPGSSSRKPALRAKQLVPPTRR